MTGNLPAWWQWPNLLSLDAPAVALVWQELLARVAGTPLTPEGRATLFLAVWAIYLADRLLDSWQPPREAEPERHRFTRDHRLAVTLLLILSLAGGAWTAMALRPTLRTDGIVLGAGVVLYLAAVHAVRLPRLPKELLVAVLFTAGTALVPWARSGESGALVLPVLSMLVLCWLNLAGIEFRESPGTVGSTRWAARHLSVLAACAALAGRHPGIALASLGLIAWKMATPRMSREAARVLADVPLLLPALLWVPA